MQATLLVARKPRFVRMAADGHIKVLRASPELSLHVDNDKPDTVVGAEENRGIFEFTDDAHAGQQPDTVSFVVSEAPDKRTAKPT